MAKITVSRNGTVPQERSFELEEGKLVLIIGHQRRKFETQALYERDESDTGTSYRPVRLAIFQGIGSTDGKERPKILVSDILDICPEENYHGTSLPIASRPYRGELEYSVNFQTEIVSGNEKIAERLDALGMPTYASLVRKMPSSH